MIKPQASAAFSEILIQGPFQYTTTMELFKDETPHRPRFQRAAVENSLESHGGRRQHSHRLYPDCSITASVNEKKETLSKYFKNPRYVNQMRIPGFRKSASILSFQERETGLEPATPTLARSYSTN